MSSSDEGGRTTSPRRRARRELIEEALRAEREAGAFYAAAASRVERRDARQILAKLAREEAGHEEILSRLFAGRFPEEWSDDAGAETVAEPEPRTDRVSLDEIVSLGVLEILAIAMWEERKAIDLYGSPHWSTGDDDELASTLRDLQQVEHRHYRVLKDLRRLIAGEPE